MGKASILVVDDEEDILELVQFHLTRDGHQVQTATIGEKAVKLAKRGQFNLILLDLMLPGIDGIDVAKALRAETETKSIPIIMLTAKGEEADIISGLAIGADDYITKPFSPRVLSARVKAVLRRRAGERVDDNRLIRIPETIGLAYVSDTAPLVFNLNHFEFQRFFCFL
jgi:two-component system phosphate regulon response regulator PhoB